jgi:hypothetical protein
MSASRRKKVTRCVSRRGRIGDQRRGTRCAARGQRLGTGGRQSRAVAQEDLRTHRAPGWADLQRRVGADTAGGSAGYVVAGSVDSAEWSGNTLKR